MVGEDRLIAAGKGVCFLVADVRIEPSPYVMAGKRRTGRHAGIDFTARAIRARKGEGPLTMRHVQAGLRLIADAERRDTSHGLTMEWDSGPGRSPAALWAGWRAARDGGLRGAEAAARARACECECLDAGVWAVCVEAVSLRGVRERFKIGHRRAGEAVAVALETAALADDR